MKRLSSGCGVMVATGSLLLVAGCVGSEVAAPLRPVADGTVPLGALPDEPSPMTLPSLPTVADGTDAVTTTTTATDPVEVPLDDDVDGTAVLLVGDTALAATAERATDSMCDTLVADGWTVAVEAERGRPIEFGGTVVDALVVDAPVDGTSDTARDWDVVGLMFGHHLSDAMVDDLDASVPDLFVEALATLIDRLGDRPVVVFTVVESEPELAGISEAIRTFAEGRPNVVVADWAAVVFSDPELVVDGGPVPTDAGADRLAELTAEVLGVVPDGDRGECLGATYVDDSAIVL